MNKQSNTNQTIDMQRARHAYEKVMNLQKQKYGNYVSYVKGLPATILQNGLGQAMATLLAAAKDNKEDAHKILYCHLQDWLCQGHPYADETTGEKKLMQQITSHGEKEYLVAQAESLAYLNWLKKFAVAYLQEQTQGRKDDLS
jgi:CRISPR-associated protein Cmr5